MTPRFPAPAWLVGCGNMAGAMVEGWRAADVAFDAVTAIRPSGTPVPGVRTVTDLPIDKAPRFVMLGVKPQKLDEILPSLAPHVGRETVLVSLLAGVTAATLRNRFPAARAIVRVMPNLPVSHRQGVTALFSTDDDAESRSSVEALMQSLGLAPPPWPRAASGWASTRRWRSGSRTRHWSAPPRWPIRVKRWPRSPGASPVRTEQRSRDWPCSMPRTAFRPWSTPCSTPPSLAAGNSPTRPPRAVDSPSALP